jgi:hypothetical protein
LPRILELFQNNLERRLLERGTDQARHVCSSIAGDIPCGTMVRTTDRRPLSAHVVPPIKMGGICRRGIALANADTHRALGRFFIEEA